MGGTAVESVPGGLLDRLLSVEPDAAHDAAHDAALVAVRRACAGGGYAAALRAFGPLLPGDATVAAWHGFAWRGAWLALPDGSARPLSELGERLREQPSPPPIDSCDPEVWIVGRLLPDLREWRGMISPQLMASAGDELPFVYRGAIDDIDRARDAVAGRPELSGHLDLLAADVAARVGDGAAAQQYWQSAWHRLAEAGDDRGLAAAAVVLGDLHAAPLASPLSWNCVLSRTRGGRSSELAASVEALEFTGSPGDPQAATAAYDDAAARYAALGDSVGRAAVDVRRGYLAALADRPAEAVELAAAARAVFEAAGRPLDAALAATHAALAAIADDRMPADLALVDTVADATKRTIGPAPAIGLALLCVRVGRHWTGRGLSERAQAALGLAERIWDRLGEPEARAQALVDAAEAARALGDIPAARVAVLRAFDADPAPLAEPADPTDPRRHRRAWLASVLYTFAGAVGDLDGMARARQLLHETVEPIRAGLAGFTGPALQMAGRLLDFVASPDWRVVEPYLRATAARDAGEFERAEELQARARDAWPQSPPAERALNEAVVKAADGDDDGASDAFARHALRELDAAAADELAAAFPELAAHEVRRIHERGLAFQLDVGNAGRARWHRDALAATATPWWAGLGPEWRFHGYEGRLRELEDDLPGAVAALDRALAGLESLRAGLRRDEFKTAFYADANVQVVYLDAVRVALRLADAAVADGHPDEAGRWRAVVFRYAERAQARALLDLMRANLDAGPAGPAGPAAELVARWRKAGADVSLAQSRLAGADRQPDDARRRLRARLEAAVERLRVVEAELQRANPRYWAAVNPQVEVSDLAAVTAVLPPGVTLLQYVVGRRDLLAWAVTSAGMVATQQVRGRHELTGLVARMVAGCAGGGAYEEPARLLADRLLEPLRAAIEKSTSLLVIPGGPLMRLPFAALPFDGVPLGAAVPLTIVPNASALTTARPAGVPAGRPLVVGDPVGMVYHQPDGPARPLPALTGTRVEAATVAGLLPHAQLLLGPDATADLVLELLPGARVVHLATHGVLDADSPMGSAILLAHGQSLTTAQLFGVRLDADLVVLSACHTGAGEVARGGELLGLGRALLAAGARGAIVTRWAVNDLSATLLMTEFHRRRLDEPDREALRSAVGYLRTLDRGAALAAFAKLAASAATAGDAAAASRVAAMARDLETDDGTTAPYDHPYHWAPFMLIATE